MRALVTRRRLAFCAVAVVASLLLSVGAGAKGKPVPVMFKFDLILPMDSSGTPIGPPAGPFTLSGALQDSGDAVETFRFSPDMYKGHPVAHGVKTLTSDDGVSTITMKFNVRIFNLNPASGLQPIQVGIGTWIIESGTGAYEGVRGSGTAYLEVYYAAEGLNLLAWYTGTVH